MPFPSEIRGQWSDEYDSALDAGVKIRPTEAERKEIGPAFNKRWNEYFANAPDKPVIWIGPVSMYVFSSLPLTYFFLVSILYW